MEMRAAVLRFVVNEWNEGSGVQDDPIRRVYGVSTLDGQQLAVFDTWDHSEGMWKYGDTERAAKTLAAMLASSGGSPT